MIVSKGFTELAVEVHPHFDRHIVHLLAQVAYNDIIHGVSESALQRAYLNTYGAEATARVFWLVGKKKAKKKED